MKGITPRVYARLLLFSLFGIALWFFGNLYEGIVVTPNLLTDSVQKIHSWREFITLTNPVFFYVPIAPIAVLATFFLYFKTPKEDVMLKRHLTYAAIFLLFAVALGIYIITQINLKLFFGDIEKILSDVYRLSLLWNILNAARVILLACTVYHVFNAYIFVLRKSD